MDAAQVARESGNMDQAFAEWFTAAQNMADFADKFPSIEWRIPLRYNAAKFFWYSQFSAGTLSSQDA